MTAVAHAIIVSGIDNTQRTLIQSWVKATADEWWHQLPDVWIAVGKNAGFWRDGVGNFLLAGNSILVLAVKNTTGGRWAIKGIEDDDDWFENHLPPVSAKALNN